MKTFIFVFNFIFFLKLTVISQTPVFTKHDTLRGTITDERKWWDLSYYHLDIKVNPEDSSIHGKNTIYYNVLEEYQLMQIDLQPPLLIKKVMQNGKELSIKLGKNAHFITLEEKQNPGETYALEVHYGGKPHVAKNAPWDGGISWKTDSTGNPFIASACQGIGASILTTLHQ